MRIYDEIRPRCLADVRGQSAALGKIAGYREQFGFGGAALWITGKSGTGKSLIASLLAAEIAEPWAVVTVDAGRVSASMVDDWERTCGLLGLSDTKPGRVWVIEEAHGLRADIMRRLLTWLQALPGHCTVIFTTTCDGQEALFDTKIDASPLVSRCFPVRLTTQGMAEPVAEYLRAEFGRLGMNGKPPAWYLRQVRDANNNVRQAIQNIAASMMAV